MSWCSRSLWLVALLLAGCGGGDGNVDAGAPIDLGIPDVGALSDGVPALRGAFTMTGCSTLDTSTGQPKCSGRAPLTLTLVPLGSGVDTFVWTLPGGTPATSKAIAPSVTYATPGVYSVMLAAGGTAGTTTATGTVVVSAGVTGSGCLDDTDCDAGAGLFCVCKPGETGCVGALGVGFCSRVCSGSVCGGGELCVDLTRGGVYVPGSDDGGVAGDVWRRALCLPSCAAPSDCRAGFLCRELPSLSAGAIAGSAYSWKQGCFADIGGSRCLSGRCDPYGARGLCSSPCTTSSDCPTSAACATYNAPPSAPVQACLRRCDASFLCSGDPLLDCEAADQVGGLGFTVTPSEATSTRFCAPLRCTMQAQCAPSGSCTAVGSGGSFCLRD
jgi:PKD repeat protein